MLALTRRLGESLIIGDDVKITVLNIYENQIGLCVNDSQCVFVNQQENTSIRDGIIVNVVKIDKAHVKLGIEVPAGETINKEDGYKND